MTNYKTFPQPKIVTHLSQSPQRDSRNLLSANFSHTLKNHKIIIEFKVLKEKSWKLQWSMEIYVPHFIRETFLWVPLLTTIYLLRPKRTLLSFASAGKKKVISLCGRSGQTKGVVVVTRVRESFCSCCFQFKGKIPTLLNFISSEYFWLSRPAPKDSFPCGREKKGKTKAFFWKHSYIKMYAKKRQHRTLFHPWTF